jgi:hypothetical protein
MSVKKKASPPVEKSWRSTLQARPVRNTAADARRGENGLIKVTVRAGKPWFLVPPLTWIVKPRFTRTYDLDALGTEIWDFCDGQRTAEEVIDEFARVHRLSFHEARASVTGYMRELARRGAIAMTM